MRERKLVRKKEGRKIVKKMRGADQVAEVEGGKGKSVIKGDDGTYISRFGISWNVIQVSLSPLFFLPQFLSLKKLYSGVSCCPCVHSS